MLNTSDLISQAHMPTLKAWHGGDVAYDERGHPPRSVEQRSGCNERTREVQIARENRSPEGELTPPSQFGC